MSESDNKLLVYSFDDKELEIFMQDDNAWFTQKSISRLFNIDVSGVTRHLGNVFESGELDENNNVQKMHIVNSKQPVKVYSLDAVISVGYRVNSQQATKFRIWATGLLKQYIRDGYVLNEAVLKNDPEKLNELAAKIRELRHTEKNVFAKVRECFKLSATDYEPSSAVLRSFYALLQDKFHHAITKMTASKLVMDRADSSVDNMGLVSFKELIPTKQEARVGKNYLTENELYRMFLLSEQFLLFAESSALMGKSLTMKQLHDQLDVVLKVNGYPVLGGYQDYLKSDAMHHAEKEYERFINIKKLTMLGVEFDPMEYELGEYADYQEALDNISMKDLKAYYKNQPNQIEQDKTNRLE